MSMEPDFAEAEADAAANAEPAPHMRAARNGPDIARASSGVAAYALFWTAEGTLGQVGEGSGLASRFQRGVNPASLVYRAAKHGFMDQMYSVEGGGLVLGQDHGQYLTLAPFSIT